VAEPEDTRQARALFLLAWEEGQLPIRSWIAWRARSIAVLSEWSTADDVGSGKDRPEFRETDVCAIRLLHRA
jgi:hypothetical protein